MLVVEPDTKDVEKAISMNVAQEYGFMRGQGKPVLPLVQQGPAVKAFEEWSNSMGMSSPRFPGGHEAFDHDNSESIPSIIKAWRATWL